MLWECYHSYLWEIVYCVRVLAHLRTTDLLWPQSERMWCLSVNLQCHGKKRLLSFFLYCHFTSSSPDTSATHHMPKPFTTCFVTPESVCFHPVQSEIYLWKSTAIGTHFMGKTACFQKIYLCPDNASFAQVPLRNCPYAISTFCVFPAALTQYTDRRGLL